MSKQRTMAGYSPRSKDVLTLLSEELIAGKYRPVYVLEGADQYRIEQVAVFIRNKALSPQSVAFNDHVLDAETVGWGGVLRQACSYPMFGGNQVVWARHCDLLKQQNKDPAIISLVEYLIKPLDTTILIISGDHFDGRQTWIKVAKERGYHVHFPAPSGAELLTWIKKASNKIGLTLDGDATRLLADLIGPDLQTMHQELQKLALIEKSQGRALEASQLLGLVLEQIELDIFSLTDLVGLRKGPQMLNNFHNQMIQGRSVEELTPLLLTHLRRAILVSACLADGMSESELSDSMKLNSWMLRTKLAPLARQFNDVTRSELLRKCLECDVTLKSRPIQPSIACEQLLASIAYLDEEHDPSIGP